MYAFADDGKAVIFKATEELVEVGRNELDGRIQATPAAASSGLIVRTEWTLYLLAESKQPGSKK